MAKKKTAAAVATKSVKAAPAPEPVKATKPLTKAQFFAAVASKADVTTTSIIAIFNRVNEVVAEQLGPKGPGKVTVPDIVRLHVVDKPATPEREILSPFTKEMVLVKAKPASRKVKAVADGKLKFIE